MAKTISVVAVGYVFTLSSGKMNILKDQEALLLWHGIMDHYDIRGTESMLSTKVLDLEALFDPKNPNTSTCSIAL